MINIDSIFSAVPKNSYNLKKSSYLNNFEKKKIIEYTGFDKVNRLSKESDPDEFVYSVFQKFLKKKNININEIGGIIYSSHSRSREMPIFSAKIQKKFKLGNEIFCFDLPNSCTGFTNGLIHAYSLIFSRIVLKKIVLICSDTHSKLVEIKNKKLFPVVGDGCSIIVISPKKNNLLKFNYGVDGDDSLRIINKNKKKILEMNGIKVFEFAIKRVENSILKLIKNSKINLKKIDYLSIHQPNKSIHNYITKKLFIKSNKVLKCFNYGNTSSSSIPLSICHNLSKKKINKKIFLFSGFGAGFLWSNVIIKLHNTKIYKIELI